ncbi:FlhB [Pseudomonas putida DOT-T1E]|uniref:FlhB n=1 Tax=Pseudomonas putida (strain DOT-T1E) TaxID=1196325 RepID=I7C4X8_PSEPT|nr:FlhB [Pseudomonas putida DOT-T1E]
MAESESGQDKTEDPTDKRKRDAREKGEIARSKELNTVVLTLGGGRCIVDIRRASGRDLADIDAHEF